MKGVKIMMIWEGIQSVCIPTGLFICMFHFGMGAITREVDGKMGMTAGNTWMLGVLEEAHGHD